MLNQKTKFFNLFFFLTILFIPSQLGRHFWPNFSFINGIRVDFLSPTLYLTDILIIFLIVINIDIGKIKNYLRQDKSILQILLPFLLISVIFFGIILSRGFYAGLFGLLKILEFVLLGFVIAKNTRNTILRKISSALAIGIIFESVLAILQFLNEGSLGGIFYLFGERAYNSLTPNIANASINGVLLLRPYGTFPHPNVLAGFLVVSMFIILINIQKHKVKGIIYSISILLGSVGLFFTLSRVAIILWIVIFSSYLFWRLKFFDIVKNKLAIFVLIALGTLIIFFPPIVPRLTQINLADPSFFERISLMKASILMIQDHLVFGVGLNNFLINLPYYYLNKETVFVIQPVHNIFLLALSEIGIVGFLIMLYLLVKLFIKTPKVYKILLLLIFVLGSFDHYFITLQQGQLLLTVSLGLCLGEYRDKKLAK